MYDDYDNDIMERDDCVSTYDIDDDIYNKESASTLEAECWGVDT